MATTRIIPMHLNKGKTVDDFSAFVESVDAVKQRRGRNLLFLGLCTDKGIRNS